MNPTRIEWADATWSPVTGCTPISEGCEHCYAARMAKRLAGRYGYPKDDPFRVTLHPDRLEEPLRWRKPRKIFVASMSDLFHPDIPFAYLAKVWDTMFDADQHVFMILTKRPERMRQFAEWMDAQARRIDYPNVWFGITAENQRTANERIPLLLTIPAVLRFVSVEPMLGSINLQGGPYGPDWLIGWDVRAVPTGNPNGDVEAEQYRTHSLDWVINGAETGSGARPMDYEWARRLRDDCQDIGIPFFFKRGNGGEEPPEDLLVREWPSIATKGGSHDVVK